MPRCVRWGVAAVAAALVAGSAVAQLLPGQVSLPRAPLTVPSPAPTPALQAPVSGSVGRPAIPQLPIATPPPLVQGKSLPSIGAVTVAEPGKLLGTATTAVPRLTTNAVTLLQEPAAALQQLPQTGVLASDPAAPDARPQLSPSDLVLGSAPSAAELEARRKQRLQVLLRQEPLLLEPDDHGNPVVRGKLLVLDPDEALMHQLRSAGYRLISDFHHRELSIRLAEVAVPPGLSAVQALHRLRSLAPDARADFDHVFAPAGGALAPAKGPLARRDGPGRLLVGMVDGGVAAHPSLASTRIEQKGFAGQLRASGHGTAVASLLAGGEGSFRGAANGASLAVADVYGGSPAAGSASAIVRGLAWLVSKRPAVINISLTGPPNRLLAAAISGVHQRNVPIVAAIGNDGPASPPQYPASYPGVLAITGVDASGRALIEAGNATQIDFAAPAADMAAARPGKGYARVRGTSFAAPLAAGRLALLGSTEKLAAEARPGKGRVGRGIVCASCRTDPARVGAR